MDRPGSHARASRPASRHLQAHFVDHMLFSSKHTAQSVISMVFSRTNTAQYVVRMFSREAMR
eukprot:10636779-Heterocapsa_arctica.AAC.1